MSGKSRPEVGGHASADITINDLPPLAAPFIQPAPPRCPCGHPICDDYRCIAGGVYGPCGDENCGGVCEWHGECKGGCPCKEDE